MLSERVQFPVSVDTRRSTLGDEHARLAAIGSSAHAEIDPHTDPFRLRSDRLLRPRGDRPLLDRDPRSAIQAPPPTRRSTLGTRQHVRAGGGSSAHAEIDPPQARTGRPRGWLLRPRGDRPAGRKLDRLMRVAPPPTRRSTLLFVATIARVAGSSAHAEIDPRRISGIPAMTRLLRPRGDRPPPRS